MTRRYTIDRFEDNGWAVLEREDGLTFDIPQEWLPEEAQEGHVLRVAIDPESKASSLRFEIDEAAMQDRLEQIAAIRSRLRQGPKGDIEL
jgi:CHASE2 domain-containing sensor protein